MGAQTCVPAGAAVAVVGDVAVAVLAGAVHASVPRHARASAGVAVAHAVRGCGGGGAVARAEEEFAREAVGAGVAEAGAGRRGGLIIILLRGILLFCFVFLIEDLVWLPATGGRRGAATDCSNMEKSQKKK